MLGTFKKIMGERIKNKNHASAHASINKWKIEYLKEKTTTFEPFIDTDKFICDSQETFPTDKVFYGWDPPPPRPHCGKTNTAGKKFPVYKYKRCHLSPCILSLVSNVVHRQHDNLSETVFLNF
jgi:hypothetical protein